MQPCQTGKRVIPRSTGSVPEAADPEAKDGVGVGGGLRLASRPSTDEGIAPAPPKCPGEGTGPKAHLGVSEHLAPSGCRSHSQAPNPQPWVHRWCLDATRTHRRPSVGELTRLC